MDYGKVIEKIGKFGRYQKMSLLVVSSCAIFNAMTTLVLNFVFGEHAHRCRIPNHDDYYTPPGLVVFNTSHGIEEYNVTECQIQINGSYTSCNSWVYDKSLFTTTIISKFDVVCEKKFFRAHFLLAHYSGMLIGSILCGVLSDTFGRKPVMGVGIIMLLISMGTRPFIPNLILVTILEFVNGCGSVILYITPFIILTELVSPHKRLFASFCVYMASCIGNYVLLLMAYLIRDWETLFLAITVPIGGYLIVLFFISESPRWLISRGRTKEAIVILEKIARFNGNTFTISPENIIIKDVHKTSFSEIIKELMKSKKLMVRLAIICFNWFALNLTYFGISMNVAKFSGDVFVNFAASSLADILAIALGGLITDKVGRKLFFSTAMILSGITCICTIFTTLYADESLSWLTTTLAMVGKFFNSIAFFVVYIFTAELFPTVIRASVIGISSMTGRTGSISSAYIGELGSIIQTSFGIALPLIILGSVGLVAGMLSLTLPETTNTHLPEYVEDAKIIRECQRNETKEYNYLGNNIYKTSIFGFERKHSERKCSDRIREDDKTDNHELHSLTEKM